MLLYLLAKQISSAKFQKIITRNIYIIMLPKPIKMHHPNWIKQLTWMQKEYLPSLNLAIQPNAVQGRTRDYVTLQDHKNFCSNPTCRLIHSSKNELGKERKQLVEKNKH